MLKLLITSFAFMVVACHEDADLAVAGRIETPKNTELTEGMLLPQAIELLKGVGAEKADGAYPLFWANLDGLSSGRHDYYNLRNGTCVQLQIDVKPKTETVVGFGVGPVGRPYTGKMEWFADDEAGLIARPTKINIGGEQDITPDR